MVRSNLFLEQKFPKLLEVENEFINKRILQKM